MLTAWEQWEQTRPIDERRVTRAAFRQLLTGQHRH